MKPGHRFTTQILFWILSRVRNGVFRWRNRRRFRFAENYYIPSGESPYALARVLTGQRNRGNASSVGVLLSLLLLFRRQPEMIPDGFMIRFLFPDHEEIGYVGTREYVKAFNPQADEIFGVISLELCGIGDTPVLWDVREPTTLSRIASSAWDAEGFKTYRIWERLPMVSSDHRAFKDRGIPIHGFSMGPEEQESQLKRLLKKKLSLITKLFFDQKSLPVPFNTYHSTNDTFGSLNPATPFLARAALLAVVRSLR
jgi:Zn-dependent M28 family amino/carboxypeptidase